MTIHVWGSKHFTKEDKKKKRQKEAGLWRILYFSFPNMPTFFVLLQLW